MKKFKDNKNTVQQLFVAPGDTTWHGKAIAFENVDYVLLNKSGNKMTIYTKNGRELSISEKHYDLFVEMYTDWCNNR